jgi:serine/threonine-protein kinase
MYDQRALQVAVESGVLAEDDTDTVDLAGGDALEALVEQGRLSRESAEEIRRGIASELVPGYEVDRVVGRGGMGVVYRAVQTELDRPVALKLVDPAQARSMRFIERFRQEAQALGKLNHANLAPVYDAGNVGGQPWIAMEFVDGDDCDTLLEQGPFSEAMALAVVRDAALALSHALGAGIVHRDIKPGNLMLTQGTRDARGTGGTTTKVTDLGLAHLAGDEQDQRVTQPGTVLGTPPYMAPEQMFEGAVDFRVDVYALGATLYHLITGVVPFEGRTIAETILNKRGASLADPRTHAPKLSEGCTRLIDRLLSRDADQRYDDYRTLIRDVEAVLAGREPATPPIPEDVSSIDWSGGSKPPAEAVAEPPAPQEPEPERKGIPTWAWIAAAVAAVAAWTLLA